MAIGPITLRVGPPSVRDPALRNQGDVSVERVKLTGLVWSEPHRVIYLHGLCERQPQGFSMELEAHQAAALYALIGNALRAEGLIE